jgi:hypothetical protein
MIFRPEPPPRRDPMTNAERMVAVAPHDVAKYQSQGWRIVDWRGSGVIMGLSEERATPSSPLSVEERRTLLQREIEQYTARGFRVLSQTDSTAQLVKPKVFSFVWAFIWLVLTLWGFGFGLAVYLIYYLAKRDTQIYLVADEFGISLR